MNQEVKQGISSEQINQEEFLDNLYQQITDLNKSLGMIPVLEISNCEIEQWQHINGRHDPDPGTTTGIQIKKAAIYTKEGLTIATVLGQGIRSRYDHEPALKLQFGGYYGNDDISEKNEQEKLNELRTLTSHHAFGSTYLFGEFYQDSTQQKIIIDSWVDRTFPYGGNDVAHWDQSRLLTQDGLDACLNIVKETIKRGK